MYCSTCGVAITESLSYCNHCGAKVAAGNDRVATSREVKPELLVSAIVVTFVLGLIAITILLGSMKSVLGLELGQILAFAVLSFLIMVIIEAVFMLLLFKRNRGAENPARTASLAGHTTKELEMAHVQALPEPLVSVTDHTTRAFEPSHTNRNKVS